MFPLPSRLDYAKFRRRAFSTCEISTARNLGLRNLRENVRGFRTMLLNRETPFPLSHSSNPFQFSLARRLHPSPA
jgi:hypothetical protein